MEECLVFFKDIDNYDIRKVGRLEREENNGIGVSTCHTSDEGYETALLDANGAHPVERYETKELAEEGHKKWVEFSKGANGLTVRKIGGWNGLIEDSYIVLEAERVDD